MYNKIAFLYPGQGAQKVGMGKDFYENYDVAKEVFEVASEVLGKDITKICFEENEEINQTKYTQIAMLATEIAITKVLREEGIIPQLTAGLSLGEYASLFTSGAVNETDVLKAIKIRGNLMETAVPTGLGGMCAIMGLSGYEVEDALKDINGIEVANYNTEKQIVITGESAKMEEAKEKMFEAGAKICTDLFVSGPFHSKMLTEAGSELRKVLDEMEIGNINIPYVSNVNAEIISEPSDITNLLEKQVSNSVRWLQSMEKLMAEGVDLFVEVGPGHSLSKMIKKISKSVAVVTVGNIKDMEKLIGDLKC